MLHRVQKIISEMGVMSRRAAEEAIRSGRVSVNDKIIQLGAKADPETDKIILDGVMLGHKNCEKLYIVLNKPKGYVTTLSDEKGRKSVIDLCEGISSRVYPVGRLDMYSEGLLLLTNDGEFAYKVTHPKFNIPKTYSLTVKGKNPSISILQLSEPMTIDGYRLRPAILENISIDHSQASFSITVFEGRNRQIRKMCDSASLRVVSLKRISEGPVQLGDLKPGKWRYLSEKELSSFGEYF